ncbi:hypothetical protein PIB30_062497 [Stylosanthes scabra]|uniref:Uncharacterized protein n=1 Tax=Stylosanthes scabra TaxID=79078 RepID=A0ABU6UMT3_9FABA|nr:hypothetical protein [Stylosanthes scabra]
MPSFTEGDAEIEAVRFVCRAGASSPEFVFRRDLKEKRDKDKSTAAVAVRRELMMVYYIPNFLVAIGMTPVESFLRTLVMQIGHLM